MLNAVLTWSLRHRVVVLLLWLGVALAGVAAFRRLPIDAFPDTTPIQVQVNTVAPALSPLEIEHRITARVEQGLAGLPGLTEVRSISRFGFSQVNVTFAEGTDLYRARQMVAERVAEVELPPEVARPSLGPVATGLGEVFHYVVHGEGRSLAELRTAQDRIVAPQLRTVPGVAEVNAWGGDERRVEVVFDPAALRRYDLTLPDLVEAISANNLNVGGGTLEQAGEARAVVGEATLADPAALAEVVVAAREGVPVRVRDLGRVVEGRELRRGAATAQGKGEVVLGLGFMLIGENSHTVTRALSARLQEVRKTLPPGIDVQAVYTRTDLVDHVLTTVRTNLLEGALLVVAVLFALMGSLRAGLIVALAIPLSMLFAFDLMLRFGVAGTLMSLGAIDFGLVVDSSVILVENAVRRLGQAAADPGDQRSRLEIVRDAALEVRKPTLFGELIILVVYLPILALEGIEGQLFRPMALTIVFALLGSMLMSLTLMPVLASLLLPRHGRAHRPNRLVRALSAAYARVLRAALRAPVAVLGLAALVMLNGLFLATRLGTEFVPQLREGALVINTVRLSGVSLDESVRYGLRIEQLLLEKFPDEIEHIWTRTGTAEIATDPMGPELSDIFITLRHADAWTRAETQEGLVEQMERALAGLPGMRLSFSQPIEMRIDEMDAGLRADVGVKLFADDLDLLKAKAAEVDRLLRSIPGAQDVVTEQVTGAPTVRVEVDREAAGRHGIPAREILAYVEALAGIPAGELREAERRVPIAVRLDDTHRLDAEALGRVLVTTHGGAQLPLSALTRVRSLEGPAVVNREWGKRRIVVQANVRGRDVGSFVAEARARIDAEVDLPPGGFVRYGGQFEHLADATERLMLVVPGALLLILVLLYFTYGRLVDAARVFTGVPFAVVGGVVALWARGIPFSISAGVGFVALSGVSVLGDMVLVSTIRQNLDAGRPLREAVLEAADQRLRPVLMTALVAGLGFVPMALNTGLGAEVQRPLATVVIGGIASSTMLTLIVLPVLYLVFHRAHRSAEP
jgi:cobalt-zinc-cadmium resistance protein CzcA